MHFKLKGYKGKHFQLISFSFFVILTLLLIMLDLEGLYQLCRKTALQTGC